MVVGSLGACRAIADLRDLEYVPAAQPCRAPALPTAGQARVRLVNAGTSGRSDFCIRATGTADWGSPVLAGGGPTCEAGLDYAQATIPFAVPSGAVDVEAVPAGAACDATATSQLTGVALGSADAGGSVGTSAVMTLVRFGRPGAERIVALPEERPAPSAEYRESIRVVDALASGETIDVGSAAGPALPTVITQAGYTVPPGSVAAAQGSIPGLGSGIDATGYLSTEPLAIELGAAFHGQSDALFVVQIGAQGRADTQSLFALGDSADPHRRVRGLLCDDVAAPSAGGSASSILASCQLTALPTLTVDTINLSLYGTAAPFEDDRRPVLVQTIAARTSDLQCIVEGDRDADKQAILAAYVAAQQGYGYYPKTDLATAPADPRGADGGVPPPPASPPCADVDPATVAASYACMAQNCSSTGDTSGVIGPPSCLTTKCTASIGEMVYGSMANRVCADCILAYAVSGEPLDHGQAECTSHAVQPFAFDGMNPSVILSRYPFASPPRAYVLPSTLFRRSVLYAPIQLEDQVVDFYCVQLSSPIIDSELPYTGNYGSDTLPGGGAGNGWEDEQRVQVAQVVRFIQSTSGASGHPAIVAGDWHSTVAAAARGADGGAASPLVALAPEILEAVDSAYGGPFVRAEPAAYVPTCQYCPAPQDLYNVGIKPVDFTPTFLSGFAPASASDDALWGTANDAVSLTPSEYQPLPAGSTGQGPLFEYYPRTVRILRPVVVP